MRAATRYRLVRTIGTGGMAQVFEAEAEAAPGVSRRVALKRMRPDLREDQGLQRLFLAEAQIAGRLYHGSIVQLLDHGVLDGNAFIVMEYVDGVDGGWVARLAERDRIPEGIALHVIAEVAYALSYVHSLADDSGRPGGIVHRDVSPSNILLSWEGDVKLSDFGIAFALDREWRTTTGVVRGKLPYMPPEQALHRPLDGSADVYALGASLHALLAGRPPSPDDGPMRHQKARISLDPRVHPQVLALVSHCMSEDPRARPSADEVARRASQLAAARLDEGGRGALRRWLQERRERMSARDALDQVLGLFVVPVEGEALGARRYTVSTEVPAMVATTPQTPRAVGAQEQATTPATPRGRGKGPTPEQPSPEEPPDLETTSTALRSRFIPITIAVVLVGATAVGIGLSATDSAPVPVTVAGQPTSAQDSPALTELSSTELPSGIEPPLGIEPPADPPEAEPSEAEDRPARMRAVRRAEGTGWVRIGGPTLSGGRVELDGREIGHAPLERELSVGRHRVRVRDRQTDSVLLESRFVIEADHTRAEAFRLLR